MTRPQYLAQLRTAKWRKFRAAVVKAKVCCEKCGKDKRLEVHHKWYMEDRKAWQYGIGDVNLLCHSCHKKVHKKYEIPIFDKHGNLKYTKKF